METITITGRCFCLSLMVQLSPEYPVSVSPTFPLKCGRAMGCRHGTRISSPSILSLTHVRTRCLALQQKVPVSRPCVLNLLCLSCHESRNKMEDGCFPGVHPLKGKLFFNICFWWKSIKTLMKQYCWGHAVVDEVGKGSCYTFFFFDLFILLLSFMNLRTQAVTSSPCFSSLFCMLEAASSYAWLPLSAFFFSLMTKWWDSPPDST